MTFPLFFSMAGKKGIEPVITEELHYFLAELSDTNGQHFDPKNILMQGISNVITNVIFGSRFDYSDEKLANLQFQNFVAAGFKVRSMPLIMVS